ncbi:MAG: ROK family glucokinase [Clostridiales bacterium]|nr:ROK family glucokinase [Clostridiales bacterium]MDY3773924.1 ROK family glucokinase [Eubacterium sp.]
MEKFYIGVDVGGTSIKMGMFSHTGELLEKWEIPTRVDEDEDTDRILPDIAESIEKKRAEKNGNIVGIGLGIPGPVTNDGVVLKCANIHWPVFNVKEKLFDLTGVANIRVGNDANVAALGEMWKGGGRGYDSIVMVTLGTGVGGGVILGGKILTGTQGAAGEIGHLTVEYGEEETCNCGKKGCLEQYASATGIVRMAKKQMSPQSSLAKLEEVTAKDIFDAAKAGDEYALHVVDEFARYLGVALANVAQILDPEAFVIGGGVARAGSIITEKVDKYYDENVMFALRDKQFHLAELGNDAGIYGAVRMVL